MAASYFYVVENTRHGPISFDELRRLAESCKLTRSSKIWTDGMAQWEQAATVAGLFDGIPPELPQSEPPPIVQESTPGTFPTGVGYAPMGSNFSSWIFIAGGSLLAGWVAIDLIQLRGPLAAGFALLGAWVGKFFHEQLSRKPDQQP